MFPTTPQHWFAAYLIVGVIALVLTRLLVAISQRNTGKSELGLEIYRIVQNKRRELMSNLFMFLLMFLLWPLTLGIVIHLWFFERQTDSFVTPDSEDAFECEPHHLFSAMTVQEAESQAYTADPLGRIPDLPFGHLNVGWQALLTLQTPTDALWYFEIPGNTDSHLGASQWSVPGGAKRGYALVRSDKIQAEFIFEWD
jgi:hypothetical protein